ncbi:hypothetical protein OG429_01945 [Streptomyces sp. NBC_00190]|uniref:hypothetical protein n=1 Tax=unclassified Streptomyces TaxID=2593676 RepID=UPI002E2CAF2C|nr:hypothetical protein [Streptomyces sp. NBC_00190]WSZ38193.1 hypothetical protein OG239_04940 [Streptomyces sp. NBC_00868]
MAILTAGSGLYPFTSGVFTLVKGGAPVLGMGGLSLLFTPDPAAPKLPAGTVGASMEHVRENIHWFLGLWPYAGACVVLYAGVTFFEQFARRRRARAVNAAMGHVVAPEELSETAQVLVGRAQQAQRTILASQVHRLDLIDCRRNELVLPEQVWEVAKALREYSRLSKSAEADSSNAEVIALQATRRRALRASHDGVEMRVVALEEYAARVREADLRYEELQQIQRLTDGNAEALDLLARTAADALAVAEIDGMNQQAAVLAKTLTMALDRASAAAAIIALPLRDTA